MSDELFENILNPEVLNINLKITSVFIAIYESFKEDVVSLVKDSYLTGLKEGKLTYHGYEEKVLSKITSGKNKTIRATILWLVENGVITEDDDKMFIKITNERNRLTHSMFVALSEGLPIETTELLIDMLKLYEKIEKWWLIEIEIPIDFDLHVKMGDSEINYDGVKSVKLEFLKMMQEIAVTDTKKYYEIYRELKSNQ